MTINNVHWISEIKILRSQNYFKLSTSNTYTFIINVFNYELDIKTKNREIHTHQIQLLIETRMKIRNREEEKKSVCFSGKYEGKILKKLYNGYSSIYNATMNERVCNSVFC